MNEATCSLCQALNEELLWRDKLLRIIRVGDAQYPGFCRVILNRHVKEMTDLARDERIQVLHAVFAVETALRELMCPDKINLASLGNQVPHLHWHVIPRFSDDSHFPDPVWTAAKRVGRAPSLDSARLAERIAQQLSAP